MIQLCRLLNFALIYYNTFLIKKQVGSAKMFIFEKMGQKHTLLKGSEGVSGELLQEFPLTYLDFSLNISRF